MATAARAKRQPPEGGGVVWHAGIHAFQCLGCGEFDDIRSRRRYEDAEYLLSYAEMLVADHVECWEFDDPEMARQARRFRKEKKRRENLARQAVSWRGR